MGVLAVMRWVWCWRWWLCGGKRATKNRAMQKQNAVFWKREIALPIDCGKALSSPALPQVWLLSVISQLGQNAGTQLKNATTSCFPCKKRATKNRAMQKQNAVFLIVWLRYRLTAAKPCRARRYRKFGVIVLSLNLRVTQASSQEKTQLRFFQVFLDIFG